MDNKSLIKKIDYIELYVTNIIQAVYFYKKAFGFRILVSGEFEDKNKNSIVIVQGEIKLILTSSSGIQDEIIEQVNLHGDFVKYIAFAVKNIEKLYNQAISSGFKSVSVPTKLEFEGKTIKKQ